MDSDIYTFSCFSYCQLITILYLQPLPNTQILLQLNLLNKSSVMHSFLHSLHRDAFLLIGLPQQEIKSLQIRQSVLGLLPEL